MGAESPYWRLRFMGPCVGSARWKGVLLLFFPDTEGFSCQNEHFLRLKKKIDKEPKSDEQRRIRSNSTLASTNPSFDPHPPQRSERLLQKQKTKQNLTPSVKVEKMSSRVQLD